MDMLRSVLVHGAGEWQAALTLTRVTLGLFFMVSGFHKLFLRSRHMVLVETLRRCLPQWAQPGVGVFQWLVPATELLGGWCLVLGVLTVPAAVALAVVCLVAAATDGMARVRQWHPVDAADELDDLLYLPEVLYIVMLSVVVLAGPGPASVDAFVLGVAQ